MYKNLMATLCCLGLSIALNAQTGWLPPDHFISNTNLCESSPWKLVFWDNFDGTQIDNSKWIKHVSWRGMSGGDNDHWNAARSDGHMNYIYRDPNVQVYDGSAKLLIKRETGSWICSNCDSPKLYRRHTSAGALATYYTLPNGAENGFNRGKLEARIRFPIFKGAWCAFWTWYADDGVNEIDVAEAWGGPVKFAGSDGRRNKYGTHAWGPDMTKNPPPPNPYNLPRDAAMGGQKFPNQGWWAAMFNSNYHAQDAWHIYTCEWDDNLMKFYIDNALLNTYWKYIKNNGYPYNGHNYLITIGSGCNPQPVTPYYINFGYPYITNSKSQIRLMTGVDNQVQGLNNYDIVAGYDSVMQPNYLGHMEVDYVRVWQRNPALENRTDVCELGQAEPVINGPSFVCNGQNITFTVSNPVPNGTFISWNRSNELTQIGTANNNSITVSANSLNPYTNGWISYKYQVPGCPVQKTVYKSVSCNLRPYTPYDIYMVNTYDNGFRQFQLFEGTYFANYEKGAYKPTFEWNIDVSDGNDNCAKPQHYTLFGQFVSTPFLADVENKNYCIDWKVKITDPQNNVIEKSGTRNLRTPLYQQTDKSIAYFDAKITDHDTYEQAVLNRVKGNTVSEDEANNPVFMTEMIEKIRAEELAPYLNVPEEILTPFAAKLQTNPELPASKFYPNPTTGLLSIVADNEFADGMPIQVTIFDLTGKVQSNNAFPYSLGKVIDLDISSLADAVYLIEMRQGNIVERSKIVKTGQK